MAKIEKHYEIICSTKGMSREDWLEWRKVGIGGSDAAAALGLSPWTSALKLYLIKKSLIEEDNLDPVVNERMFWGTDLEPNVANRFAALTGKKVQKRNAMFRSKAYPWMIANIDRFIVGENAALECKTANWNSLKDWEDGHIPIQYEAQIQHYMAVLGLDRVYVACLVGGQRYFCYTVERNQNTIDMLIEGEKRFWIENIMAEVVPLVTGNDNETMQDLYPEENAKSIVDLPEDYEAKLKELEDLNNRIKELEAKEDQLKNEIKNYMQLNETAKLGNWTVTWKSQSSKRFDTAKFKAEQKDIYDSYLKETEPSRVFKYNYKEDKKNGTNK